MSDSNWFSKAGNLDDPSDNNNTPAKSTSYGFKPAGKDINESRTTGSSVNTYIKPVKGLKTNSTSVRHTPENDSSVYAPAAHATSVPAKEATRCRKCGAVVPKGSTLCWKCSSSKSVADKKAVKKNNKLPLVIILCVIGIAFLGGGIYFATKVFGQKDSPKGEEVEIRHYYEENAKILSITPVNKSVNTPSETDVISDLKARGFAKYPVTTSYSIDGKYESEVEISEQSSQKHPIYETYYVTENKKVWTITVIDGVISATPSSYNLEHSDEVPIEVSESKEVMCYDNTTNSYFRTIPKVTALRVRVVNRIDAQTLESLDLEG